MNKLLQAIKKNDEKFETLITEEWNYLVVENEYPTDEIIESLKEDTKSYITQSRIKELEALMEMTCKIRAHNLEEYEIELTDILQDTIDQLKN